MRILLISCLSFLLGFSLAAQSNYRIAILGCHRQFEPAPALVRYLEAEPDLCLWIGDNVYADTEDDITFIEKCYAALEAKPAFQLLYDQYPLVATWDDHDYGLNDAGKEYSLKEESKALFRSFWGLEEEIPADRDGIYYAKEIALGDKTLQIILLDVRYNRDLPQTNGDVLGEAQWRWLEQELQKPADLRLLVSGFQILLDERAGSETWAKFPDARRRLFQLIRRTRAEGVVFLTGDQHYGEVCRMPQALDYDAIELQFAGINQIEDPEWNPLRVAPVIRSEHSYALLDIQMGPTENEVPHLLFQIYDAMTDQLELTYRVNLSEVQLQLDFSQPLTFVETQKVSLDHHYARLEVRYTLDGSDPTGASTQYTGPLSLSETTTVKAAFFDEQGNRRSRTFSQTYTRLEPLSPVPATGLQPGLAYEYFEGNFSKLDEVKTARPLKNGVATDFDIQKVAEKKDHFAIIYQGYLDIPADGVYTFSTYSDDGSRLYLHDQLVVDNDGSHSARLRKGLMPLKKGIHPIRIEYFEDYDGETLVVKVTGQDGEDRVLPESWLKH